MESNLHPCCSNNKTLSNVPSKLKYVNRVTLNDKLDKINVKLAWECGLYHFMTGHLGYYNFHDSTEWDQKIYEVTLE